MLINPILASSARRRMRSWKTPLILLLFGAALLGIAFVTALMPLMGESMTISSARNGLDSYIVLVCAEFALIVLVAPAMTAGSIAGERERQTLEMLLVTNTGSFRIALGKLLESLGYLAFLIVAMLPFNCSILAYGSVGLPYLFQSALFLLLTAYAASSVGLFCSALFRKTVSATIAAYIVVLAIGLMTFLGVTLSGASTYYDFDLAALSREELIALLPRSFFFCPPLGLLAVLANQSGALQSVLQQLVGYGNGQALALAGYDLLANAVMAFMACAATVLTLLSTAFVRPRLHARRRRK